MRRFALLIISGLIAITTTMAAPTIASAAPTSAQDANLAQALFASGKDAMAKGDLPTAEKRFSESLKLDPAVGTLLNLAACEEKQGKVAIALTHFTTAKSQLPKDDFRIAFTTERITALTARVAKIVLKISPSPRPAGARVFKDGTEVEATAIDAPILVDPGAHVIVYEVTGEPPTKTELTLKEGEERTIELGPKGTNTAPTPPTPPPTTTTSTNTKEEEPKADNGRRTWGWVTGGVAVAGFATGVIAGLMTISAASTYKEHCTNGECDPEGLDAASTGRTVRVVSPVGFGVGIAFGIASAWLFMTSSSSPSKVAASGNGFVVRF